MSLLNGETVVEGDFISTSAGASDEGKVPKLNADGELDTSFIPEFQSNKKSYYVAESMDGSTTPVAVMLNTDGFIQKGEADVTGIDKFIGFVTESVTGATPTFVNYDKTSSTSTLSFTANAGTNRVLIVGISTYQSAPTGVTYDGNAMTLIDSSTNNSVYLYTYQYAIGTNLSNDSAKNVVVSGSYTKVGIYAAVYSNVNQTTPTGTTVDSTGNSTNPNGTLDPSKGYTTVVAFANGGQVSSWSDSLTQRGNNQFSTSPNIYMAFADVLSKNGASVNYDCTAGSTFWNFNAFELIPQPVSTSSVQVTGRIDSFTGLTPNAKYYLSNTAGEIGTSAGSTSVLLGKALSATELLIIQG